MIVLQKLDCFGAPEFACYNNFYKLFVFLLIIVTVLCRHGEKKPILSQ